MKPLSRAEFLLMAALMGACLWAVFGPAVAQTPHYHRFADQRSWLGIPCATDVLTNAFFALAGAWGLCRCGSDKCGHFGQQGDVRRALAAVFFGGLVVTSAGSAYYHLRPDNLGLAWDRLGMALAFAGLLGLAVADRISARAGVAVLWTTLVAGPVAVWVWYLTGNLLAWSVLQGGGMVLILALACLQSVRGEKGLPLVSVILLYALAKVMELGDHWVFAWTQGVVSGHSLKHVVAAMAALPVLAVMHNRSPAGVSHGHPLSA